MQLLIEIANILAIVAIVTILLLKSKGQGIIVAGIIVSQIILSSIVAILVFNHGAFEYSYSGSWITGSIPIRLDYLSAWFILIINFTFLTGTFYGIQYMKKYIDQVDNIMLHSIAFILTYTALIDICMVQNAIVLLIVWELMALGSFLLVTFEHYKTETLKAGINFLIQSHICILFLTFAFMWVKVKTGSFDFQAITTYTSTQPAITSVGLFLFFFCGFAIKAGFVPFHTWLPLAHPAAPAHISGIMSGVIIKIGIYGILRVLMLLKTNMVSIGYMILFISIITGLYGVMLAIIQHNLKKLLAYHSIENIGIIGIGIGLGCLGIGYNNQILIITGFGGALLHTLNHSLFKSLLFYCAGNVYQAKHTMNIDGLGGLLKSMPRSGFLFLIGALAICGLPPFNGFVSEFFIYNGLYKSLSTSNSVLLLFLLSSILGMVLIGGLALICFTKAFGIAFLGNPREISENDLIVESPLSYIPLYFTAFAIIFIGIFPFLLNPLLLKIVYLYQPSANHNSYMFQKTISTNITGIGWYSLLFIFIVGLFYYIRHIVCQQRKTDIDVTWACGYVGKTSKIQYTASSFIRGYRKLTEPFLLVKNNEADALGLYSSEIKHETQSGDKLENWLIDYPFSLVKRLLNRFVFLQNGNLQIYILYGFIFISFIILLPLIVDKIAFFVNFLNQL